MRSSTNTSRKNSSAERLTSRALNRATLARQLLLERSHLAPIDAIEQLAGLQAQVPRPPFIGLWTRLAHFTRDDLHALITRKQVVRATMMRATIHLVSARDYLAWRPILQPVFTRAGAGRLHERAAHVDLKKLTSFARKHVPATFADLRTQLVTAFPEVDERALAYLVRLHLPLVMEPTETRWSYPGNARWAYAPSFLGGKLAAASHDDLVLRYLRAFGPATVKDAQVWSGDRTLGPVFARLRPQLVTFTDERGRELFDLPEAPRPPADTPAPVRYLPDYDNLMLSHDDRSRVVDDAHRPSMTSTNGIVYATYLVDGRIAGKWTLARAKATATLTLIPYRTLTRRVRGELEQEGDRLLRFVEPDATRFVVTVGS